MSGPAAGGFVPGPREAERGRALPIPDRVGILREPSNHLELFYQPQFSLTHESITGVEALLRWNRGDALWTPDRFLPLLSVPRMRQITDYCLRAAIKAIASLDVAVPIAVISTQRCCSTRASSNC